MKKRNMYSDGRTASEDSKTCSKDAAQVSRRNFLKNAGLVAGTTLVAGSSLGLSACTETPEPPVAPKWTTKLM